MKFLLLLIIKKKNKMIPLLYFYLKPKLEFFKEEKLISFSDYKCKN